LVGEFRTPAKPRNSAAGEPERKEREDGGSIHDRGFEQKLLALGFGKRGDAQVIVDERPFVGADGVSHQLLAPR